MALLNVRLSADDARRVVELRRHGVQISKVVRDAIRAEHERQAGKGSAARDAAAVMARIYADHPDPPDAVPRRYDLRDRRAVRQAIADRLRKRRA